MLDRRDVGKHKNGMPANGPPCDLNSAFSVAENLGLTVPSMRTPWTGSVAVRCHPWRRMPGSMSTSSNCSGRDQPPTPVKKVRGTQQMPDVLQKRGPRPSGRKGAGHGGRPQYER